MPPPTPWHARTAGTREVSNEKVPSTPTAPARAPPRLRISNVSHLWSRTFGRRQRDRQKRQNRPDHYLRARQDAFPGKKGDTASVVRQLRKYPEGRLQESHSTVAER